MLNALLNLILKTFIIVLKLSKTINKRRRFARDIIILNIKFCFLN